MPQPAPSLSRPRVPPPPGTSAPEDCEAHADSRQRQERAACIKARPRTPDHLPRVSFGVEEIARTATPCALLRSQDLRRPRLAPPVEPTIDVLACRDYHGQGDAAKLLRGPRARRGDFCEGFVQGPERQERTTRLKPEIIVHGRHRIPPAEARVKRRHGGNIATAERHNVHLAPLSWPVPATSPLYRPHARHRWTM